MGKWFFNYQVEYIHHYLFRMLVDASKPPTNTRLQRYTKVLNCANVGEGTFLRLSKLFFSTPITLMSLDKRLSALLKVNLSNPASYSLFKMFLSFTKLPIWYRAFLQLSTILCKR